MKPVSEFNRERTRKGGYGFRCRECEKVFRKQYRAANREKEIERNRRYYSENKEYFKDWQQTYRQSKGTAYNVYKQQRRARKKRLPDTLTPADVTRIYERFEGKCSLTGVITNVELDHFIAISTGFGGTTLENMIPLSRKLNASKGCLNPYEWYKNNKERYSLSDSRFDELTGYLAQLNNMTSADYKAYVYDCYAVTQASG